MSSGTLRAMRAMLAPIRAGSIYLPARRAYPIGLALRYAPRWAPRS